MEKKFITIEIVQHKIKSGAYVYEATSYPGPGVYELPEDLLNYHLVEEGNTNTWMIPKSGIAAATKNIEIYQNQDVQEKVIDSTRVSMNDLLRVVAISKQPDLLSDLINK